MNKTLQLQISTPLKTVVELPSVVALRAEDKSGAFGIWPNHTDLLTVLVPSVIRWRTPDTEYFCAVDGGILSVSQGQRVTVACREAVLGDSLEALTGKVEQIRLQQRELRQNATVEQMRLYTQAIRQLLKSLYVFAK